jgi:SAM-dependent methyltransferase
VQLLDVIDPEALFRNYIYVTGTSSTMARHNVGYAQAIVDAVGATADDLVVEVASNDGSLLARVKEHGPRVLGVEPARNIAEMARAAGVETVSEFFDLPTARALREKYGAAKAVVANNVLAHVDDTQDFMRGFAALLADDGLAIVEAPYLADFVERLEYDTVYHEHLCYFSVTALMRLCDAAGLSIVRMDRVPVHGGSLRMFAAPVAHAGGHAAAVLAMADEERQAGLTSLARFESWAAAVRRNREAILELLGSLRASGHTIAAYGAPAKGNTLLNYCGIGRDLLDFTVDRSPLKVGLFTPGAHLPVLPVGTLLERQPDYVLILAWNFADEIVDQQSEYRKRGGRFILPIPEPRII